MLDAIRNLGILKMIEVSEGAMPINALCSVESYLKGRIKAIDSGLHYKTQFESVERKSEFNDSNNIGIFSRDGDTYKFYVEQIGDDSTKYLFLKTSSNGKYLTPTWKVTGAKDRKGKEVPSKLQKTLTEFSRMATSGGESWVDQVYGIFTARKIEIPELGQEGKKYLDFKGALLWAIREKKVYVFSVKLNGKYPAEIEPLRRYALENKAKWIFQTKEAQSFYKEDTRCSLCGTEAELYPNILSGAGINIANVDKVIFFPGVTARNAGKAFPICAPCGEALYAAKAHVFPGLIQEISGHQALVIPHILMSDDHGEGMDILISALSRRTRAISGADTTEKGIIEDLSEINGISTVTFLFGEVKGQSVEDIRKVIPDVLPSRLSEIAQAMRIINEHNDELVQRHPWRTSSPPLDGSLSIIRHSLGERRYNQKSTGNRRHYTSTYVDSLNLLNAIFLSRRIPISQLYREFAAKLSYDFLGSLNEKKDSAPVNVICGNITQMETLLRFLSITKVIDLPDGMNFATKYLDGHPGLAPLHDFLTNEAKGLDTPEKEYVFLTGLLFGKLVNIQLARKVSPQALKWVKGLKLSGEDVSEIYIRTFNKLNDYSTPKSVWSNEMKGVKDAISGLGSSIDEWNLDRSKVAYYFCLGHSLAGYYLPGKTNDETVTATVTETSSTEEEGSN